MGRKKNTDSWVKIIVGSIFLYIRYTQLYLSCKFGSHWYTSSCSSCSSERWFPSPKPRLSSSGNQVSSETTDYALGVHIMWKILWGNIGHRCTYPVLGCMREEAEQLWILWFLACIRHNILKAMAGKSFLFALLSNTATGIFDAYCCGNIILSTWPPDVSSPKLTEFAFSQFRLGAEEPII